MSINDETKSLKEKVEMAIQLFMENDKNLLKLKAHEQAISHRIAGYLESMFQGYNVDCEYNKDKDITKKIQIDHINTNELKECNCRSCKKFMIDPLTERNFRPDIIVHKRRSCKNNLIVVEMKKKKICPFDIAKLKAMTDEKKHYKYKLGVFLYFPEKKQQFYWIVNGKEEKEQ